MTRTLSITLSLCALLVSGAFLFVCWKLSAALDTTRQAAWNVSALAWNSQPTVQHVNEATDVWAQASRKQAEAADELLRDLRAQSWHVDRTLTTFNAQMEHVGPLLDSLRETTHAATGTLTAATKTIQTVNDGTGPLLDASRASVKDFDALLKNPNIPDTLSNVQSVTQNTAGITLDLRKVTDKATADYLSPKPWYRKIGRFAGDAFDYGALFARHVP